MHLLYVLRCARRFFVSKNDRERGQNQKPENQNLHLQYSTTTDRVDVEIRKKERGRRNDERDECYQVL
jgi:hypothetical protein